MSHDSSFTNLLDGPLREEAEAEESKKKSDEMRLNLAIQKSKEELEKAQVR